MIIRPAKPSELRAMDALRRANQEAVAFVPMARWEEQLERKPDCLMVGLENDDLVAYCYWTPGLPVAAIQQLVVRSDARRQERATELIEAVCEAMASDPRRYGVTCRCRVDLEATAFWEACGFVRCRIEDTGGRRGPAIRYYREIAPALLNLALFLPERTRTWGMRTGFRWQTAYKPRLLDAPAGTQMQLGEVL